MKGFFTLHYFLSLKNLLFVLTILISISSLPFLRVKESFINFLLACQIHLLLFFLSALLLAKAKIKLYNKLTFFIAINKL